MQPNRYSASTTTTGKKNRALQVLAVYNSSKVEVWTGQDSVRLKLKLQAALKQMSPARTNPERENLIQPYASAV